MFTCVGTGMQDAQIVGSLSKPQNVMVFGGSPRQTPNLNVMLHHLSTHHLLVSCPDPPERRGSGDIRLIPWASLKIHSLLYA